MQKADLLALTQNANQQLVNIRQLELDYYAARLSMAGSSAGYIY